MKPTLLPLAASLALALPAAATQDPAPEAPPASGSRDERARELKRLLHLSTGQVLRAKSRWAGDRWEVWSDREWKALPPGAVERAPLERDVLDEARRLAREVDREQTVQRVALADWMLGQGLIEEGLAELDRVLVDDPDEAAALDLLARRAPPVALPGPATDGAGTEDWSALLRFAAGAPPAVRELAVLRLAASERPDALIATLHGELLDGSQRRRAFAALALRRLYPGRALGALAARAVLDGSEDVRDAATRALAQVDDPAVVAPIVKALGHDHPRVRAHSIEALAGIGQPVAVEPLMVHLAALNTAAQAGGGFRAPASNIFIGRQMAYVQDFDVEVAQGAAIADPQVNVLTTGSVLDVRVIGLREISAESRRVRDALGALTGASPGDGTRDWLAWWEQNRHLWTSERFLGAPGTTTTSRQ